MKFNGFLRPIMIYLDFHDFSNIHRYLCIKTSTLPEKYKGNTWLEYFKKYKASQY